MAKDYLSYHRSFLQHKDWLRVYNEATEQFAENFIAILEKYPHEYHTSEEVKNYAIQLADDLMKSNQYTIE